DNKARKLFEEAKAYISPHCKLVETEIATGPTAMMIEQVAKDENYGVTVMTPGKHSPAERLFSGSVTARAVAHVPGTVVVSRPHVHGMKDGLRRVLFGFDGSHNARQAIERSLTLLNIVESDAEVV